jgi:hypothetical protein
MGIVISSCKGKSSVKYIEVSSPPANKKKHSSDPGLLVDPPDLSAVVQPHNRATAGEASDDRAAAAAVVSHANLFSNFSYNHHPRPPVQTINLRKLYSIQSNQKENTLEIAGEYYDQISRFNYFHYLNQQTNIFQSTNYSIFNPPRRLLRNQSLFYETAFIGQIDQENNQREQVEEYIELEEEEGTEEEEDQVRQTSQQSKSKSPIYSNRHIYSNRQALTKSRQKLKVQSASNNSVGRGGHDQHQQGSDQASLKQQQPRTNSASVMNKSAADLNSNSGSSQRRKLLNQSVSPNGLRSHRHHRRKSRLHKIIKATPVENTDLVGDSSSAMSQNGGDAANIATAAALDNQVKRGQSSHKSQRKSSSSAQNRQNMQGASSSQQHYNNSNTTSSHHLPEMKHQHHIPIKEIQQPQMTRQQQLAQHYFHHHHHYHHYHGNHHRSRQRLEGGGGKENMDDLSPSMSLISVVNGELMRTPNNVFNNLYNQSKWCYLNLVSEKYFFWFTFYFAR